MRILLDTNILIHREGFRITMDSIGIMFLWLEKLKHDKAVHPESLKELENHKDPIVVDTMLAKLKAYPVLKTVAPLSEVISNIALRFDTTPNDKIDTLLLNEVYSGRVDLLISEDKKLHTKAKTLGISANVYNVQQFIESCQNTNPELADYETLSIRKAYFGNLELTDTFFDSFRNDYLGFDKWFKKKADEVAYVTYNGKEIVAFLYIKAEDVDENYSEIEPKMSPMKRLKIGTFKVTQNGIRLGERCLKIIFDNAIRLKVNEIYVTIFDRTEEQRRLINLLTDFGFTQHGIKHSSTGEEMVLKRKLKPEITIDFPRYSFPYFDRENANAWIVPIYPQYHTELFPDSILRNESPDDYVESKPHRNAISKTYVCRSQNRGLSPGDVILFYRTGDGISPARHSAVGTTIGIVESIRVSIPDFQQFKAECGKRTVFTETELLELWDWNPKSRPFVVNFLNAWHFGTPKPNRNDLIRLGVIPNNNNGPRGFELIPWEAFNTLIREFYHG